MKKILTLSAFVIATTLIVCGGCTDPATVADRSTEETAKAEQTPAPRVVAADATDRLPAADGKTDHDRLPTPVCFWFGWSQPVYV